MKILHRILLISICTNCHLLSFSQNIGSNLTIFGNTGLIETPTARIGKDKSIGISSFYMPEKYRVLVNNSDYSSELHFNLNIVFLPFAEITASLIRPLNGNSTTGGIGDRSFKLKLLILNEKKYIPSIVIGIHDPAAANTNNGAVYIVGTKNLSLINRLSLDMNLGYGLDISRKFWESSGIFMDDGSKNISRLKGIFGGLAFSYNRVSFLVEYDTDKWNYGLAYSSCKYFDFKLIALSANSFSAGITINLE